MTDTVMCCNCDKDCTRHHFMCDAADQNGEWCPECFELTACYAGVHGEGCSTRVFASSVSSTTCGGARE
jgi:hypothetical protein